MVETGGENPESGPDTGRRFRGLRKVRLGDVRTSGRLRLDALTRYTQDVSDDDTTSAGLDPVPGWIVRRTKVIVGSPAQLGEELSFVTYCSGLGRRWAERRLDITGSNGAGYEVVTLWVCVDPVTGRPRKLTEQFLELFAPSAQGRTVKARLIHPKPPNAEPGRPWPLRVVDFDVFGHVNNAAYWVVLEEVLGRDPDEASEVTIEYSVGIGPDDEVTFVDSRLEDGRRLIWLLTADGVLAASASIRARSV